MKFCKYCIKKFSKNSRIMTDSAWKGVPIEYIIGSQSPWGAPEFPLVQPAYNHAVLYHIPASGAELDRPPKPQIGKDKWDQNHVRMPFSTKSLYPVENNAGERELKNRWEMIQQALSKPMRNSKDLANAILSYNTQFKNRWKFHSLHYLFEEHLEEDEADIFFNVTLPEIAKLALALPKLIQSAIPLLQQHKNRSVSLSQQQISSLLANAFFCTFPRRNTTKKESEYASYPHINFIALYDCQPSENILEKLKCICHYFKTVCTKVPVGVVTLTRRSIRPEDLPAWGKSDVKLDSLPVHIDPKATIEEAHGLVQVDFANKYLGGGVLGHGCVQEEIRFMICPELIISMLITESLRHTESLMIIGCEQYSRYSGYGQGFQWCGAHVAREPYDSSCRRRVAVLAIDALPLYGARNECRPAHVDRELNKAWVGFSFYTSSDPGPHYPGVATGNWGCGAFGGSAPIKSLIQMMALAQSGRPMAYYTFGDDKLRDNIVNVYEMLVKHDVTVGKLYKLMLKYCVTDEELSIYEFLEKSLAEYSKNEESMELVCQTENIDLSQTLENASNHSPDLFGPDDDFLLIPPEVLNPDKEDVSLTDIVIDKMVNAETKMPAMENEMANTENKMETTRNKMDTDSKKSTGELSTPDKSRINETRMSISPLDISGNTKTNQSSRLFDEMDKLDEDGNLNLKNPHKSFFGQRSKNNEPSREVEDKIPQVTPDTKKKLARKITDYFSKKPV